MEIQRGNVNLWRKLKDIETNPFLKKEIEKVLGSDFFNNIDDLVK